MVVVGLTTAVVPGAGLVPLLAVQLYGAAPPEVVNVTDWPLQIIVDAGLMETVGAVVMDTLLTAMAVQVPLPDMTV